MARQNKPTNPKLWSRAKSMARSKFTVYPCVPLDSYTITKEGLRDYENLSIGDEILSYNIDRNELEWSKVLDINFFENAPLVEIGKPTGFKVRCTSDHSWVVGTGTDYSKVKLVKTNELNRHMRIICCAQMLNDSTLDIEDWSKKDYWTEKVLAMSNREREVFLSSAIVYDGWDKGVSSKIEKRHTFGFSQKNEDHFYAAVLAAFLNGYHVTFGSKGSDMLSATIIRNKKFHNTQNLFIKDTEKEDVWCPQTENGTWVMVQNGFITITGNSAYANAWAVRWYNKQGGGWRTVSATNPTGKKRSTRKKK